MLRRRKILFVAINQRYINATNALLPSALGRSADLYLYGPGFVDGQVLERGIERYIEQIGGVDFIVVAAQCVIKLDTSELARYLKRFTAVFNKASVTDAFLRDVEACCKRNHARVICAISEIDPHTTQQSRLDLLAEHAEYFMGWGHGFLNATSDLEAVSREHYIQKQLKKGFEIGLFDRFAEQNRHRFINIGHFVGDHEFYWASLAAREYDVAVPGSGYARRQEIRPALAKTAGVKLADGRYRIPFQLANRLGLRPFANFYLVNLYNLAFQKSLAASKACVTDGGANNYPVRKFLEIPAAGSLMVCWPAVGMRQLGFRDREHCFYVRENEEVIEIVKDLARDPLAFERIASAGRDLVLNKHSVSARAAQFEEAITRIEAGTFGGSSWSDGNFVCEDRRAVELSKNAGVR